MQSAWLLVSGAGLGAAVVCIAGNVWQGDGHTISTMPDIVTGLATVLLIAFGARRAMRWYSGDKRHAGVRAAAGAALAFGVAMGVFGWRYFTDQAVFMTVGSALSNGAFALAIGLLNVQVVTGPRLSRRRALGQRQ